MAPAARTPAAPPASRSAKVRERARALNGDRGDELPEFGPPKASDMAETRRRAAAQNRAAKEDYERDQAPKKGGGGASSPGRAAGARSTSTQRTSSRRPVQVHPTNILRGKPTTSSGSGVQEGAGFLLGLFLYALFINYLRAGPAGVRGWLAAKFLNKPVGAPTSSTAKPTAAAAPAGTVQFPSSSVIPLATRTSSAEVSA